MTSRGNTRFSFVLFLGFLLTSPTRASSGAKGCAALALAWNGGVEVSQLLRDLIDCLDFAKKTYGEIRETIKQLPKEIDKVLPVSWTKGLVLLSVYIIYKGYLLYDGAKNLEVNIRSYRDKFERMEEEMKAFRDFIKTELIPQWEAGNTANLKMIVNKLLEKIDRHSAAIQELTQAIRQDIKTFGSSQRWLTLVVAGGVFVCLGSLVLRPTPNVATPPSSDVLGEASFTWVSLPICVATTGAAGYRFLSDFILPELERLEKDASIMGQEITRYQSELDYLKLRAEL